MAWSSIDALDETEFRREGLRGPFAKSTFLHLLAFASLFTYGYVHHFFHGSEWGSNSFQQGAIQATLVSSAAVPLPQEHPPTQNVLATETPSQAPDLEQEKAEPIPLPEALPIPEKPQRMKKAQQRQTEKPPPQQEPKQRNKAEYGAAAPANLPRSAANHPAASNSVAVTGGDFGSRFGWYVNVIKREVAQNWYLQEVQPGTPAGATAYVQFEVKRDGSPGNVTISASSGVPSLDTSCVRAVERVETFGVLPAGYNQGTLNVLYHCTFPGR